MQASEAILQIACAILATSVVWQTLPPGTSQMWQRRTITSTTHMYNLMLMTAFASITHLRKLSSRLQVFQDEGCINRGPRYLSWSQGQANENEQWCNSMGNQPKQIFK